MAICPSAGSRERYFSIIPGEDTDSGMKWLYLTPLGSSMFMKMLITRPTILPLRPSKTIRTRFLPSTILRWSATSDSAMSFGTGDAMTMGIVRMLLYRFRRSRSECSER